MLFRLECGSPESLSAPPCPSRRYEAHQQLNCAQAEDSKEGRSSNWGKVASKSTMPSMEAKFARTTSAGTSSPTAGPLRLMEASLRGTIDAGLGRAVWGLLFQSLCEAAVLGQPCPILCISISACSGGIEEHLFSNFHPVCQCPGCLK